MNITSLLWKMMSLEDQMVWLSQLNAVNRTFYKDLLAEKGFPDFFEQSRSIFIHVPKCAGTSVGNALYPGAVLGHKTAAWYQTRFPEKYNDYFTYAFTRNPWDRVVSAWSFLRRCTGSRQDGRWADLFNIYRDFDHFVYDWLCPDNIIRQIHFAPQYLYICDSLGSISLDYVGRLENIDEDFVKICKAIGINAELRKLNKSRDDDYRSYYSDKTAEHVANVYARDIRLFGYCFE